MLGVDLARVKQLCRAGRLPTLSPPDWLADADVWIPVDALFGAPTPLDTGRPLVYKRGEGCKGRQARDHAQSYPTPATAQKSEIPAQNSKNLGRHEDSRNASSDKHLQRTARNVP